jgi:hypothetical protein
MVAKQVTQITKVAGSNVRLGQQIGAQQTTTTATPRTGATTFSDEEYAAAPAVD